MPSVTKQGTVIGMARTYWDAFHASRERAAALDAWATGRQYDAVDDIDSPFFGQPYAPREQDLTDEYRQLSVISPSNWGGLVVKSLSQTAYLDGVTIPGVKSGSDLGVWDTWQRNRMDRKQIAIHKAAIAHGASYAVVMPGKDPLTGAAIPRITPYSALRMCAFYNEPDDEFPALAIEAQAFRNDDGTFGWTVTLWDETAEHHLECKNDGNIENDWSYIDHIAHPMGVTPVTMCANSLDLDGKASGEIEGIIPILRRIDQTTFDRFIVQRFGAWKIRYISGMAKPSTQQEQRAQALKLRVEDLLISTSEKTKFGTLDATPIDGFIQSGDTDLRYLSAITQTPPHHLLGLSSNLQAEALAAAESGLQRKSVDFKMSAGEFYEQTLRLTAILKGDRAEAEAYNMQARWRDTESRSFMQTVQGLAMAATALKIPLPMLWEKFPGWTDEDVKRATENVESGAFDKLLEALGANENATLDAEQAAQQQDTTGGDPNADSNA